MAETPKPGSIVHVEFHVKEPKKVEKFYASLFGWKFQEVPGMNYSVFQAPSGPGGGIGGLQPGNWPPGVINYISVNSVDERSEEHTSELQSPYDLVCRLLLEKKKKKIKHH